MDKATHNANAATTPQLFYRFEITGSDGQSYPVVIAEDGLFLGDPTHIENFDAQFETVLRP